MKKIIMFSTAIVVLVLLFSGCDWLNLLPEETPTYDRMVGLWEVTGVYDSNDSTVNILDTITLGYSNKRVPVYFYLNPDDDEFQSTAGPLFLYLVYGKNNWTTFFGKLDQIFDYVNGKAFTNGEWGIAKSAVTDTFALRAKVMPPSMQTFTTILDLIPGINTNSLKKYVIHHFTDVNVEMIDDTNMEWRFTDNTDAYYYTQNAELMDELWTGWSANNFSRCKIVLKQVSGTLEQQIDNLN